MSSRREAIFVITRWLETRHFPNRLIPDVPEHAFITDLVYTTVRRYRSLEWALQPLLKKMPKGETGAALLVGAAQLLFMPDVAEHAAIYETVEAAKLASRKTAALVNGVLRNLQRQRASILETLEKSPIALRTSHPDALVTRWVQRFGETETAALCAWNNQPAATWLAVPPGTPTPFDATFTPHPITPNFYLLPRGMRVEQAPGFNTGAFIVQDPATTAAIELLDLHPGLRVLDACAAPGGKTIQLAWRLNPADSELVALELHEDRLQTLTANLQRTQQTWVRTLQGDLTAPDTIAALGHFDRILLDVPCSNSGVLRRRPDARWRWSNARVRQLAQTQQKLLRSALKLLAPGGRLVYATCSLEHEENRRQITLLRKEYPEVTCAGVMERIPTRSNTDGAFAAALQKP